MRGKYIPGNGIVTLLTAVFAGLMYLFGIPRRIEASVGYFNPLIAIMLSMVITYPAGKALYKKLDNKLGADKALKADMLIMVGTFIALGASITIYTMRIFRS